MLMYVLLFNLILPPLVICKRKSNTPKDVSATVHDLGGKLPTDLRKDANLDLSVDEEYEDLQAELFAYQTALSSLATGRRSLKTTPCWKLGGICINHKLCQGHRSLSQVAGCRDKLEVCCFTWNNYQVRDMTDKGLGLMMPWSSTHREFGGLGVIDPPTAVKKKSKKGKKLKAHIDDMLGIEDDKHKHRYKLHEHNPVVVILRHKKET